MDNMEKIIGEAAYQLLIRNEKISVAKLNQQLQLMAAEADSSQRKSETLAAIEWLQKYRRLSAVDERSNSPLRGLIQKGDSIDLSK
jgi:hypothetical protein